MGRADYPKPKPLAAEEQARYDEIVAAMYAEQGRLPNGRFPDLNRAQGREPSWAVAQMGLDTYEPSAR